MGRALWKGSIHFGLVDVPVSLYPAESRKELGFRLLDKRDMSAIGYRKVSKKSGREVPARDVVRAYEYEKGEFVVLSDEDFRRASPERAQRVDIQAFIDASELDPAYFDKPYYLEPAAKSDKAYALLREALKRAGKIGVATVVIRAKQYLAALLPRGALLELCLLRYHYELDDAEELRLPDEDVKKLRVSESEIKMAQRLIEDLAAPWRPEDYKDAYREELLAFIRKKAAKGQVQEVRPPKPAAAPQAPADIMALLKRSVAQAEKGRSAHHGRYLH